MTVRARLTRLALATTLALCLAAVAHVRVAAQPPTKPSTPAGSFDIRTSAVARTQLLQRLGRAAAQPQRNLARLDDAARGIAALKKDLPEVRVTFSPLTGGAEVVRNPRGALTPPAPGADSRAIVTSFLHAHASLYGLSTADLTTLQVRGESVSPRSGLRMLRMSQAIAGVPVFQSDTRFLLDRDGRLVRTVGLLASGAGSIATTGGPPSPAISAQQARAVALQSVGITAGAANDASDAPPTSTSRLVYFPLAPGVLVFAYEQATFTNGPGNWLTVVDASTGTLLWRKNVRNDASTQQARFSVYVQSDGVTPADSPAPRSPTTATPGGGTQFPAITRTNVEMLAAQDPVASPNGWIPDGGTTTIGNNVDACVDRISGAAETNVCDAGALDNNGRPVGNPDADARNRDFLGSSPRDYTYTPAPLGGDPDAGDDPTGNTPAQTRFRRGAVTQVFYVANWYHDRLFALGFDEAAGNFQTTNFSGQGLGDDAVRADVQDSSGTDNANFTTLPDGQISRLQMYRFVDPDPDRDGALDAEILVHELTHGVSNRLLGNAAGLMWHVGQGLGEGWSDFYALSLLNATQADDPDAPYAFGAYSLYGLGGLTDNYVYGVRRFPYSTDNTINPLTWADVDDVTASYDGGIPINPLGFENAGAFEVHNVGEVWAITLWEVRSRIIHDPAGANGNVAIGNQTMLQLVTDALKMTPSNPSVIEARDALIDADCVTNACANERAIWEGFADRGLGYGAVAPLQQVGFGDVISHMSLGTSSSLPHLDVSAFAIDDSLGNDNGTIDPGEPVRLGVTLVNPWRNSAFAAAAGATATLTSTTPGVTIVDGSSTFGAIAAGGGTATGDTFLFRAASALTCGQSIAFTLQITSSLGVASSSFVVRVGAAAGTGAPITYTKTVSPALAIPDNRPHGVFDTLTIADDREIADLDFRVDNLQHTYTGDLTVLLRAPNGYGADLIWLRGVLFGGLAGDGDNFVNTLIDDSSTHDLHQATAGDAPFTGDWMPAFNSPVWYLFGDPAIFPDPVGQLSRLNGLSTKGDWTVLVADQFDVDTGTLHGWSLIVTPRAFTCAPFTDTTPPTTAIALSPAAPSGANGWHVTPVQVTVSASAAAGDIVETRCALDPATTPATFDDLPAGCAFSGAGAGSAVTSDGVHHLFASSIDTEGNAQTPVSATFEIDRTAPIVTCALPAPRFVLNQTSAAIVTASVVDVTSGAAAPTATASADVTSAGAKTVLVSGSDIAGNGGSTTCPYTVLVPPSVTIVTPTSASALSVASPFLALAGTASDDTSVTAVTWSSDRGGSGTATGTTNWTVPSVLLQTGVNVIAVTATDTDGNTSTATLTVTFGALTYYLADGSTGSFFDTEIALANPHAVPAHVSVTFLKDDLSTIVQDRTLPPTSRTTIRVDDVPGLEATAVSTIVASLDLLPIGVERTMFWDRTAYGGHGAAAVDQPRTTWLFAEGSQGFFHTYVLLLNPNPEPTTATVRFLPEVGPPVVRTYPMPALSRSIVDASTVPEIADSSFGIVAEATKPIIAERSMYFGDTATRLFSGGHASAGVPDASKVWFFAEGATGSFFDTYVLLSNPSTSAAHVTLRFLLDTGTTVTKQKTVAPNARLTVSVESEDPLLANAAMSTEVTADIPIVAERTMYWVGDPPPWTEGHNSFGMTETGTRWILADGRVGGPLAFQTYILLGNPTTTAANVTIRYLRTNGTVVTRTYVVPPTSRFNVQVHAVPGLADESVAAVVEVTNGVPIFVEKALYWNADGIVWAGGTNVTGTRLP